MKYILPALAFGAVLFIAYTAGQERDEWHRQRTAQVAQLQAAVQENHDLIEANTNELAALRAVLACRP